MIDTPLGWFLLFGFGLFTGTLAGILGIGGGLLNVPALTLAGATTLQAAATSLIGVLLSGLSGSIRNLQTGTLNWKVALILGGFGLMSAQVGSWLGASIPDAFLSIGFAVLALTTIYLMGLKRSLVREQGHKGAGEQGSGGAGEQGEAVSGTERERRYPFVPTMGIGVLAGMLSGLFGVGGGAVMVPLQMLALNEPIKIAVRTSLGAIVAIASSALIRQSISGHVLWIPGLCLGGGAIIGAQFGTRLLPKLSDKTITTLFRLLLLGLSSYMLLRGIKALG
ncbi:MAG: sulfite exporter TauE/SafE family protein [Cyanobacteria bacterium P01_F01_bin.150]